MTEGVKICQKKVFQKNAKMNAKVNGGMIPPQSHQTQQNKGQNDNRRDLNRFTPKMSKWSFHPLYVYVCEDCAPVQEVSAKADDIPIRHLTLTNTASRSQDTCITGTPAALAQIIWEIRLFNTLINPI